MQASVDIAAAAALFATAEAKDGQPKDGHPPRHGDHPSQL
jgi:hypothetical protein